MVKTLLANAMLAFLVLGHVTNSAGWWFFRKETSEKCQRSLGAKPYYFGTSDLRCISKHGRARGKREASPFRGTLDLLHRWIEYDGWYFEYIGSGSIFQHGSPFSASQCYHTRERSPAGYSNMSVDCIKRCTQKYSQHFGKYDLWSNNCHIFANRISDILCSWTTCPSWC